MTSANGQPAGNSRRPSAAFPRFWRGALPSGEPTRTASAARALRNFLVAAGLAGAILLPPGIGLTGTAKASPRDSQRAAAPRLPDAPLELLPVARTEPELARAASPRSACLLAARRAEQVHGLPRGLLVAIALSESGLHAHALSIGGRAHYPQDLAAARHLLAQTPAESTVMAGCVQVNARVHARGSDWPLDPVRSTDWAGGILRRWYMETGTWDQAIRRWHGGSAASTRRVMCRVRAKLEVTAPGSDLLQAMPCRESETRQAKQNGMALLEVAEMQDPAPR
jgi:hypothetical protein